MELNEHHHQNLVNFLKFSRYRRSQQLRAVDGNFEDLLNSRVSVDETYTGDELEEMLKELNNVVKADVESELLDSNHTNCLLLRQLFQQAEKWHLKLNIETSELENKALLNEVAKLEDAAPSIAIRTESKPKLAPIQDSGPVPLLQMEIGRLEEENSKLRSRLEKLEIDATNTLQDKGCLKSQVNKLEKKIEDMSDSPNMQIQSLMAEIDKLNKDLSYCKNSSGAKQSIPDDYVSTKHHLLAVQSELEKTQGELDKKFSETTQYNNLKKMLTKKNDQLKELRSRLRKYEPTED